MNTSNPYIQVLTYIETGNIMEYTNTGSTELSPGDPVPMAGAFGVAIPSGGTSGQGGASVSMGIAPGATGPVVVHGVVSGPANSTEAFAQGQQLYWNATNGNFDSSATGNTPAGYAWMAKASGVAVAQAKLPY